MSCKKRCSRLGKASSASKAEPRSAPGSTRLPPTVASTRFARPAGGPRRRRTCPLKGDVVAEVSKLKKKLDGDLLVYASYRLGHALMESD